MLEWADQVWTSWPAATQQLIRDLTITLVPPRYFHR